MEKRVNTYYSVRQRRHIQIDPNQQTTGELIVKDLGLCEVPHLAETIDRALNKELEYGVHLGQRMKGNARKEFTSCPPIKDDKKVHVQKSTKDDGKRTRRSRKKV